MRLRLYHHRRRRAGRLPRGRHRAGRSRCSTRSGSRTASGSRSSSRCRPLPRRAAGPAAARRQRGPPAPPLHARLARRGRRRLLRGGARPAAARRRARPRRRAAAARGRRRPADAAPPRADAEPPAPPRRAAHRPPLWRGACRAAAVPGLDRLLARGAPLVFRPSLGERLSAQRNPAARDLVRHALADVPRQPGPRALVGDIRAPWPSEPQRELLDAYRARRDADAAAVGRRRSAHPLAAAREALDLLPDGQLRVLDRAGFLLAYDDPVGLARELISFCGQSFDSETRRGGRMGVQEQSSSCGAARRRRRSRTSRSRASACRCRSCAGSAASRAPPRA